MAWGRLIYKQGKWSSEKSNQSYIKDTFKTRLSVSNILGLYETTLDQILFFNSQITEQCNSQRINDVFYNLFGQVLISSEIEFRPTFEICKLISGRFINTVMMVYAPCNAGYRGILVGNSLILGFDTTQYNSQAVTQVSQYRIRVLNKTKLVLLYTTKSTRRRRETYVVLEWCRVYILDALIHVLLPHYWI